MEVREKVVAVVLPLQLDELPYRAEVIADVECAGGLDAGKNPHQVLLQGADDSRTSTRRRLEELDLAGKWADTTTAGPQAGRAAGVLVSTAYSPSSPIASTGQASTHTPQSMHASLSMTALSLSILIASLGQSSTHDSQPVHFAVSTFAGICFTLSKN